MTDTLLAPWATFYSTAGGSAAALTGLMFVVISIVNERIHRSSAGFSTFSTPTVVHFSSVLLISIVMLAPWPTTAGAGAIAGAIGALNVLYLARVSLRARRLREYTPDLEDWVMYTCLPLLAYLAIAGGGFVLIARSASGPFALAGGVVLLTFIGIRNAWDVVTYLSVGAGAAANHVRSAATTGAEPPPPAKA